MSLKGFNLLQDATLPPDAWDKVYDWVTNAGRIIVIVVELIVIGSFVARVIIDTQTKELQKQDQTLTQILIASRDNELRFRDYQQRFTTYKTLWNNASSYDQIVSDVIRLTPRDIENISFTIRGAVMTVQGKAPIAQVRSLESTLKGSQNFSRVLVPEISTDAQGAASSIDVEFSIRIDLKPEVIKERPQIGATQT